MYDITKKRVAETAKIELTDGDGAPLLGDNGDRLSVTLCGPGCKTWQQADADRNRKRAQRAEKNPKRAHTTYTEHGREDDIDFLVSITVSFNGWDYPAPASENGEPGSWSSQREMFKAAYQDDRIGYIRDHLLKEGQDWTAFVAGNSKPSGSTPAS